MTFNEILSRRRLTQHGKIQKWMQIDIASGVAVNSLSAQVSFWSCFPDAPPSDCVDTTDAVLLRVLSNTLGTPQDNLNTIRNALTEPKLFSDQKPSKCTDLGKASIAILHSVSNLHAENLHFRVRGCAPGSQLAAASRHAESERLWAPWGSSAGFLRRRREAWGVQLRIAS